MSKRARSARRLASLLTIKSGTDVRVHYEREARRYRVVWINGPDVAHMHELAVSVADAVPELNVVNLLWRRDTAT